MKKLLLAVLTATLTLSIFCFAGCKQSSGDNANIDSQIFSVYSMYKAYAEEKGETPLSYEEWLASIKGEKGEKGENGKDATAHTHTLSDWITDKELSCGKAGLKHKECTECKAILEISLIDALTHEYENYICKHCGDEYYTEGLHFKLLEDETGYEVVGIDTKPLEIIIPSKYKGLPVTIGNSAFYECSSLTSITVSENNTNYKSIDGNLYSKDGKTLIQYAIGKTDKTFTVPNSVTSISNFAFYNCRNLTSVTIPNSVTSIGASAFYYCSSLTSVTIGNSVTSIDDDVFYGCYNLTSVTIPNSVTSIGASAFYDCSSLTSITIGNSVTSIGERAFYECSSLTSVTIGNSVTSIDDDVFYGCYNLTSVTIPNSVTSIGDSAFSSCVSLTNITIPNSVTSIGDSAFYDCRSLTSVTIPNSVTSIGNSAFSSCVNLTNITIPNSVTSIGDSAFSGCSNLTYNEYDNAYYLGNDSNPYVVLMKAKSTNITSCTINENCKFIYGSAFHSCVSLTNITIPNSITSIGDNAFSWCTRLTSVYYTGTIDQWVQIGFSNYNSNPLYSAKNLYIDNKLVTEANITTATKINAYAFSSCGSLTSVTIGNSVTSIGNSAFA